MRKAARPQGDLVEAARCHQPRAFDDRLIREGRLTVLAEIKRASPSAGAIRVDADPGPVASRMEAAGADALSVLIDSKYFSGSFEDMRAARAAISLPVLEKDFVIDEYQVYEAAAAGADAILLIVRILSDEEISRFYELASGLGLGRLVEVHDEGDLSRAMEVAPRLIGINNRDLATFTVDIENTLRLMPMVPPHVKVISQSGINNAAQAARLYRAGVAGIQVGESLMRSEDPGAKIRELLALVH